MYYLFDPTGSGRGSIALVFFGLADNASGCEKRSPGGITMNLKTGALRGWLRPSWQQEGESLPGLKDWLVLAPSHPLRKVPGRETYAWPENAPRAILKRTSGDLFRDRWHDWLHLRFRSPGQREFDNLQKLGDAGFCVPFALGWGQSGRVSFVLMEYVAHGQTLRQSLELASARASCKWAEILGRWVGRLHAAGWYHRDLYLEHWVLTEDGGLCLLDLGRARQQARPRRRWLTKDLGALLHSSPANLPSRTRLRFLVSYFRQRGLSNRIARRRFARDVENRRVRIASHAPRHVSPPT